MAKRSDVDDALELMEEAVEAGALDRSEAEEELDELLVLADESEFAELYAAGFWDLGSE